MTAMRMEKVEGRTQQISRRWLGEYIDFLLSLLQQQLRALKESWEVFQHP